MKGGSWTRVLGPGFSARLPRRGAPANVLLTCEHASDAFPAGLELRGDDSRLRGTHWAVDIGARDVAEAVQTRLVRPGALVAMEVSRLVVDVNRPPDSPTLFRESADGAPVALNAGLDAEARADRLARYYHPFHAYVRHAAAAESAAAPPRVVLSVHSFTPVYEGGPPRAVEVGVLYSRAPGEAGARALRAHLCARSHRAELNAPWSGLDGFMYTADLAAAAAGCDALMVECRQDLSVDPAWVARFADDLASFLNDHYC